jgi:hypothetical protein
VPSCRARGGVFQVRGQGRISGVLGYNLVYFLWSYYPPLIYSIHSSPFMGRAANCTEAELKSASPQATSVFRFVGIL